MERFIGYIVSFLVVAGMGVGLPRWFEWRRALAVQRPGERTDGEPVGVDHRRTSRDRKRVARGDCRQSSANACV